MRRLQVSDINDPLAEIVREHLDGLGVAAIRHAPLIRAIQDKVNDWTRLVMSYVTLQAQVEEDIDLDTPPKMSLPDADQLMAEWQAALESLMTDVVEIQRRHPDTSTERIALTGFLINTIERDYPDKVGQMLALAAQELGRRRRTTPPRPTPRGRRR